MLGLGSRTVQFAYAVDASGIALANQHRDAIKKALASHKSTKKWKIAPDMFLGQNLGLSEAMGAIYRKIDSSHHYIFLTDGERLTAGMQRMLREWPQDASRSLAVFINDEALTFGNDTRMKMYRMSREGYALSSAAAHDERPGEGKLRPADLAAIINHLLKK